MEAMFFGQPNQKGKFHIFDSDKRSLCGRWSMPFLKPDDDDLVKGTEKPNKDDCHNCFEKLTEVKPNSSQH